MAAFGIVAVHKHYSTNDDDATTTTNTDNDNHKRHDTFRASGILTTLTLPQPPLPHRPPSALSPPTSHDSLCGSLASICSPATTNESRRLVGWFPWLPICSSTTTN